MVSRIVKYLHDHRYRIDENTAFEGNYGDGKESVSATKDDWITESVVATLTNDEMKANDAWQSFFPRINSSEAMDFANSTM